MPDTPLLDELEAWAATLPFVERTCISFLLQQVEAYRSRPAARRAVEDVLALAQRYWEEVKR